MGKTKIVVGLAMLVTGAALSSSPLLAQAGTAPASTQKAAQPAHYSVSDTLVGKLLEDPAAVAILKELIPTVYATDQFQSAGRNLTLKDIQQYEAESLSDENLAKIQAAFDKIPVKD